MQILPPRFIYGAFFLIFLETMSQGKLRKEWLEENGSFSMTRLSQPQLPGRGTIWSPSYSRVKANSEVLHRGICLDLDHHVISPQDSPFWSRDLRDIPIESSEINLHSILDFRSMPIKSSIQNSRLVPWFWLMPNRSYVHPSYQMNFYWKLRMDCFATTFIFDETQRLLPKVGRIERNSSPSWPNS